MENLKKYLFNFLFFSFLFFFIYNLTIIYSEYYSDLHHWGFIASTSLDYINGRLLFKEVLVHYGAGQLIFFDLINSFYKINFTSIGIVTSIIYYLNLLILYFIIKKISNLYFAFIFISAIFFVHPFITYPWPDYMAGLCLTLFFYFTLFNSKLFLLSGFFLFLSVLFRSTYIVGIFFSTITYLFFIKFNKKLYNNYLAKILLTFLSFLFIYLFYLFFNNNLSEWFLQSIGAIKNYAEVSQDPAFGFSDKLSDKVASFVYNNLGSLLFSFFQLCKFIIKFVINILFPKTIEDFIFFIFYIINFFFIFLFIVKKKYKEFFFFNETNNGILLFFSLLGFFGVIQSLYAFNFFRNFNASSSVFFISAFFFKNFLIETSLKKIRIYTFCVIFFLLLLLINFFNISKSMFEINKNLFQSSSIQYFGNRKFAKDDLQYYSYLNYILCKDNKKIFNFTLDFNLTYLCNGKDFFHFVIMGWSNKKDALIMKDFLVGSFDKNTIYVSTIGPNIMNSRAENIVIPPKSISYFIQRSYSLDMYRSSKIYIYQK
jgi:hypothetical protein